MEEIKFPEALQYLQVKEDSNFKIKCPWCSKPFLLTSIQKHLGQSKVCKPKINKEILNLVKELSDSAKKKLSNAAKADYDAKRYQEKKPELLQQ